VPYRVSVEDKFRNYVIGLTELGLPLERCLAHFRMVLAEGTLQRILQEALAEAADDAAPAS
jgi:hypothetical protein